MFNFHILTTHSAFSRIFKGASAAMASKIDDFVEWKEVTGELSALDFVSMDEDDLGEAVRKITPPIFERSENDDDGDNGESFGGGGNNDGLWVKGYELTALQTMLLSEAVRQADHLADAIEEYFLPNEVSEHFAADLAAYRKIREDIHCVFPRPR